MKPRGRTHRNLEIFDFLCKIEDDCIRVTYLYTYLLRNQALQGFKFFDVERFSPLDFTLHNDQWNGGGNVGMIEGYGAVEGGRLLDPGGIHERDVWDILLY
jgi:hypothetical protein